MLVIREVFTSVEINDVQLVLAVVLLDIAKGLDSSANTHLDLLPDLVANRDQVLLLREQLHIFDKNFGELFRLVVGVANIPLNCFLHIFHL